MADIQQVPSIRSWGDYHYEGFVNSKTLPDGIVGIYLQDRLIRVTVKNEEEPRIACAISLLSNLKDGSNENIESLAQQRRIAAIEVANGRIQSLILPLEQLEMIDENGVNDIVFQIERQILLIKENISVKMFPSEEVYHTYVRAVSMASREEA